MTALADVRAFGRTAYAFGELIFLYVVVGPLVGGMVFTYCLALGISVYAGFQANDALNIIAAPFIAVGAIVLGSIFYVPLSYLFGTWCALPVGILVAGFALTGRRSPSVPSVVALAVTGCLTVGPLLLGAEIAPDVPVEKVKKALLPFGVWSAPILIPLSVIAALACWQISHPVLRRFP